LQVGLELRAVHFIDVEPRVAEILSAEGYLSPHTRREGLATGYFQENEDAFFAAGGMGAIDIHWKITPRSFRFAPDEESFWRRAHAVELEFGEVTAIAPADLLLFICVHAAKHGWVQLGSLCDVAETVRARPAIDLMAMLDEDDARQPPDLSHRHLPLAHELAGAPIPEGVVAIAGNDRAVRGLASRIAGQLFSAGSRRAAHLDPWAVPIRSIEGARARIHHIARRMLAPTMGDYELIRLPKSLFPL